MEKAAGIIFGEQLRTLRLGQIPPMSQVMLARALEISVNGLNLLEHGAIADPHVSRLVRAATLFQVSTDYLLGRSSAKPFSDGL